ncbi:MAG TPA: mechanosensitive ion channel domain-containing protein [Candidatus Acidoferrum sp.]|jgi:small-conductance mechanosensitive channel|nr:mechanosensitive ion channel domain-containing protein [Candidatus Acidoferrum sp.]
MGLEDYLNNTIFLGVPLITYIYLIIIAVVSLALERVITRYLRRFAKRTHLPRNVTNNVILTFRLLILVGAVASVVKVGGLPTDWILYFSTIGGAAVGFASTKTIGNFVAGLYLFATRPFRVGDYVRIGTVEGIVEEITINYTKVHTIGDNIVSIANLQVMDRDIISFSYDSEEADGVYCYTFEVGFDHSVSTTKIEEIFNATFKECASSCPRRPSYMLTRSDAFGRVYTVYLYVKKPQDIFSLRPRVAEELFKRWDMERTKAQ